MRDDLLAGLAVAMLVIPQSLAYAQLAGMPPHHGLYAAFIPCIVGALFGSSALLSTGPVALTSLLTAASVGQLAAPGSPEFVGLVLLLALLSGLIQMALGAARAGLWLNLLSHPVLMGFINAAAVVISLSQLQALTGIAAQPGAGVVAAAWHLLQHAGHAHGMTLAFSALSLGMLVAFKRWAPRWPGVLIMVVVLTMLSRGLGFAEQGGAVVGHIPPGLPRFALPAWDFQAATSLLSAALVVALVSFMEAMSSCKVIAVKTQTPWNENQELIGQGLAKVVAAFCQALPVSGSFSRSAMNLASGARSGWSSLLSAALVVLALLFFTPWLVHLPKPALAAMIVMAVLNLIDLQAMRNAWRAGRDDGVAATLTFVATLAFAPSIQNGILAGITFALGAFIYRRMLPRIVTQALSADGQAVTGAQVGVAPLAMLRFEAALFFANASFFEAAVARMEREQPQLKCIIVQAQSINLLDATGVEMLKRLLPQLRERGVALYISSAKQPFLDVAERTGLLALITPSCLFDTDAAALASAMSGLPNPLLPIAHE